MELSQATINHLTFTARNLSHGMLQDDVWEMVETLEGMVDLHIQLNEEGIVEVYAYPCYKLDLITWDTDTSRSTYIGGFRYEG